ncbi:MAG: GNAT family N-acetyltransferase [Pseudomonadota bacterium]
MIRSADGVPSEALRAAMLAAFSDYAVPMQPSQTSFNLMLRQRGFVPDASLVTMAGDTVVAIWLVGRRGADAYLIASGTRPEDRGRGLARAMADRSLAGLVAHGARTFTTEVMDGNAPARALYLSLGMEAVRPLDCYQLVQSGGGGDVVDTPWDRLSVEAPTLWDWPPTWQNDVAALSAVPGNIRSVTIWDVAGLAGYAARIETTMTLAQIAVRPDRRRNGLGRALVGALAPTDQHLRIINADGRDPGFRAFAKALGATPMVGQTELRCAL